MKLIEATAGIPIPAELDESFPGPLLWVGWSPEILVVLLPGSPPVHVHAGISLKQRKLLLPLHSFSQHSLAASQAILLQSLGSLNTATAKRQIETNAICNSPILILCQLWEIKVFGCNFCNNRYYIMQYYTKFVHCTMHKFATNCISFTMFFLFYGL